MNTRATVLLYGLATLFCIAFNAVYGVFGHGVSSPFMTYAFSFCLVLGVGGFLVLGRLKLADRIAFNLYNAGIVTLTVGSLLRGVLDIAGADAPYPAYYFVVGALLTVTGALLYARRAMRSADKATP